MALLAAVVTNCFCPNHQLFLSTLPQKLAFVRDRLHENAAWERSDHERLLRRLLCRDDAQEKPSRSDG
jgi:hypothetical protein